MDDVIVVGGGLSGLTAANQIIKQLPSIRVRVLEARGEVGGRTQTVSINGYPFDLGATQRHVIQLAQESNNELVSVDVHGRKILQLNAIVSSYASSIPSDVNVFALLQLQFTIWKIDRMAGMVPLDDPKGCVMGHRWDSMTLQTWVDANLYFVKLRVMVEAAVRVIFGVQLCELSFLYFLWYVRQNGGFENILTGLQEKRTKNGAQSMSLYLEREIRARGGEVQTSKYVRSIENELTCRVVTRDDREYRCRYIIMAMPPACVNKISFSPRLSEERSILCARSVMGTLTKVILLYDKRYWTAKGFSGQIVSDCVDGPAMIGYDDTHTNERNEVQPALNVFVGGALYQEWKQRDTFIERLVQKLALYFGDEGLKRPMGVEWKKWDEEESIGGAPVAIYPPGVLSRVSSLKRIEGNIHWAGTQTADESSGFMDGAIQAGKRAAAQIIARMEGKQVVKTQTNTEDNHTKWVRGQTKWIEWW